MARRYTVRHSRGFRSAAYDWQPLLDTGMTHYRYGRVLQAVGNCEVADALVALARHRPELLDLLSSPSAPRDVRDAAQALTGWAPTQQPTSGSLIMPDGSIRSPADVTPIPGTAHGHPRRWSH